MQGRLKPGVSRNPHGCKQPSWTIKQGGKGGTRVGPESPQFSGPSFLLPEMRPRGARLLTRAYIRLGEPLVEALHPRKPALTVGGFIVLSEKGLRPSMLGYVEATLAVDSLAARRKSVTSLFCHPTAGASHQLLSAALYRGARLAQEGHGGTL
jgi:hypothetical protein